jgi:DNA repair protein RecN (Recombination protein N)
MLRKLSIRNYALIEKAEIGFDKGLSVITGETGAGKSILLGALGLIQGQRADASVLFNKEDKCVVEAVFDVANYGLEQLFEQEDIDFENQSVIRREITPNGKSRAFINDTPVTVALLKTIAERLIDIHSQHQNLLLGDDNYQLAVIDTIAGNSELKATYRTQYQQYKQLVQRHQEMIAENEKLKQDQDYLTFQFNQLKDAKLEPGELPVLEEELERQTHAEEIKSGVASAVENLSGEEFSAAKNLADTINSINKIAPFLPSQFNAAERLEAARIDLADLAASLERFGEGIEFDMSRITFLQQRIDLINSLMQRHKVSSPEELIAIRDSLEQQLKKIIFFDDSLQELQKQIDNQEARLNEEAIKLTESRRNVFGHITSSIESRLRELGIANAVFVINHSSSNQYMPSGRDEIEFMFSANKNGTPDLIAKVASGGEMSRVMLSIKSLLSSAKGLPTIIFDEIDTGVSGEVAGRMGSIMAQMSSNIQVVAITHLPQIASKGNQHFKVFKTDTDHHTVSSIVQLGNEERITEIAKMLSGTELTEAALQNARDLMKN